MNYQSLPNYIKGAIDNETPFKVIKMGQYEIRHYWSKKGTHDFQVYSVAYGPWNPETESRICAYHKTGGCGYDKEANGFAHICRMIGVKPKGMVLDSEGINQKYHVGGNFYRVPKKDLRKA